MRKKEGREGGGREGFNKENPRKGWSKRNNSSALDRCNFQRGIFQRGIFQRLFSPPPLPPSPLFAKTSGRCLNRQANFPHEDTEITTSPGGGGEGLAVLLSSNSWLKRHRPKWRPKLLARCSLSLRDNVPMSVGLPFLKLPQEEEEEKEEENKTKGERRRK